MTVKMMKPDERGNRPLSNGSIIYKSGADFHREGILISVKDAGKFMLWVKDGDQDVDGRKTAYGHFVMDDRGPRYFKTTMDALLHLQEGKR